MRRHKEAFPRRRADADYLSSEPVWNSRVQWGAIMAGAFAGLAATLLMTTLGAAIGITAGAVGVNQSDTLSTNAAEKAAMATAVGTGVWLLLTALVAGLVGGWALNSTARRDRAYSSVLFGGISWAVGMCLMLAIAAPALGGIVSGLGAGAGTAAAATEGRSKRTESSTLRRDPTDQPRAAKPLSDEEKVVAKDAADKAAAAASVAAWLGFAGQALGLMATMLAAGRKRHTGARVVTEIRPRPIPTA